MDKELQRKYKIIAGASNIRDILDLLEYLAQKAANVTVPLGIKEDSLEIRKGVHSYLQSAVDSIRRIKDNKPNQRPGESSEDSI